MEAEDTEINGVLSLLACLMMSQASQRRGLSIVNVHEVTQSSRGRGVYIKQQHWMRVLLPQKVACSREQDKYPCPKSPFCNGFHLFIKVLPSGGHALQC